MTQPTLQECLEWLSKEPDVCDWFEHYEGKPQNEIINAIRAQLEAGAACAESSYKVVEFLTGDYSEYAVLKSCDELKQALTKATASSLIAEGK